MVPFNKSEIRGAMERRGENRKRERERRRRTEEEKVGV